MPLPPWLQKYELKSLLVYIVASVTSDHIIAAVTSDKVSVETEVYKRKCV